MVIVRDAVPADADALAAAHIEGWRVAYRGLFPDEYLDAPEFARQRIDTWRGWTWNASGRNRLLCVEAEGAAVGFSLIGPARDTDDLVNEPGTGEVYAFYLRPGAWGTGAAAPLMRASIDHLRAEAFTSAVLWVLRDNPRARRFYERERWRPTGRSTMWAGPVSASHPPEPAAEVEYGVTIAQDGVGDGR